MRHIDADALVYELTEMVRHSTGEYKHGIDAARLVAMEAPTVDAAPVKHGHWEDVGSLSCRCSECGCKNDRETMFCPNCGAKMDLEDEQ